MEPRVRLVIGINDYSQDFKCSGTCARTDIRKEGIYVRIFQEPETPTSGDTIVVVCSDCLTKGKFEGYVDLSRQQTSVILGPY